LLLKQPGRNSELLDARKGNGALRASRIENSISGGVSWPVSRP
jgi:hypothetical protein